MKKASRKLSPPPGSESLKNKKSEPFDITYANPVESEFQIKYAKEARVSAHIARWFLDYKYEQLIWSDGIYEILEIDPLKSDPNYFTFLEIIHPNDRHIKISAHERLKSTNRPIEITYRLLFNDGRIKWLNEICNTDFDGAKNAVRSYGTIQDITRFKLQEEEFNKNKERFNSLIELMPQGITIIQGNKFVYANASSRKLFGENQLVSLIGKKITTILAQTDQTEFKRFFAEVKNGSSASTFESTLRTLLGDEFSAEITLIPTIFRNSPAVELVVNDITERKKAEYLLRQNEIRLNETIATKDKFLSIIAHDLRSPFNSILGFLDILENQYNDFDDFERKSYIRLINENATKTLKLLDNLLVWAKAQTGKLSFNPVPQKLLPIIQQVAETMDSSLQLKNLQLKVKISPDTEIFADTNMLRTILRNLLNNAIKYSFEHGFIQIEAERTEHTTQIILSDNGVGMSEEITRKLFKIDEEVSTPGTANETGSGLGLILCKDFIDRHSGKISVKSKPGEGSTFTLLFPDEFSRSSQNS